MHIVFLSDHETEGGAAVAASRLAEALTPRHCVTRLVLFPDGRPHPWRTLTLGREPALRTWAYRAWRKLARPDLPLPGTPRFLERRLRRLLTRLRPDIVHVHNLHAGAPWGWSVEMVRVCGEVAPVVWTLHDMWSFTGRCAYAYDCRRFETGCDESCPTACEHPALEAGRIRGEWLKRRRLLEGTERLVAVTPSRWMAEAARRGLWKSRPVYTIPYGVPLEVFRPLPKSEARRVIGLPLDRPVLLAAAHNWAERRKGPGLLAELWAHVSGPGPWTLAVLGQGQPPITDPRVEVRALGYVSADAWKALAYSAADLFLHPAPVDNLPNVLLESLACGTPAVGLPVGGVGEIIKPGATGWLADDATGASLGKAVGRALAGLAAGDEWRVACRTAAASHFCSKLQAARYEALYRSLLAKSERKVVVSAEQDVMIESVADGLGGAQ